MDKTINQVIDELYNCLALQLQLINQLRNQINGVEGTIVVSTPDTPVSEMGRTTATVPSSASTEPVRVASRKLVATRYATRSYPMKGGQAFKNPSEDSSDKYFKLNIYSDNTFSFDLCNIDDVNAMQTIKDNNLLSEEVATLDGNIDQGSTLKVNTPGSGRVEGRLYYIERPMNVSVVNKTETE